MNRTFLRRTLNMCGSVAALLGITVSAAHAQEFIKTVITHLPSGSAAVSSLTLNDNNWIAWTRGLGAASQVSLWDTVSVQAVGLVNGNNRGAKLNNNNKLVWYGLRAANSSVNDVYLWQNGTATNLTQNVLAFAFDPTINNLDDIAFVGPGIFPEELDIYYKAHTSNQVRNLTAFDPDGDHIGPKINNVGKISWERTILTDTGGRTDLYFADIATLIANENFSSVTIASQSADTRLFNGDLNDSNVCVWEQFDGGEYDVFSFNTNSFTRNNLSATLTGAFGNYNPVINNVGMVAWYRWRQGNLYDLYWRVGNTTQPIPLNVTNTRNFPVAVNNNGALAYATGDSALGYDIVLAVPARSLGGTITLQQAVTNAVPLTFTFTPTGGGASFDRTVTPAANGAYTIGLIPVGNYQIKIKGSRWLRKNAAANLSSGNITNLNLTLKGGDASNDNFVDIADLIILIAHYNKRQPDANYLEAADFNNDGANDIADLLILISNYNQQGD